MGKLPDDLLRPDDTLLETHISWVLLGPQEVWKIKKPVDFGFLNFRRIEQRHAACAAEVQLNRRLAHDVYLGLIPITIGDNGRLVLGGAGEPVDWAVHMRRLPDTARADIKLAQGRFGLAEVDRVASRLATFHAQAAQATPSSEVASPSTIARNIHENFEQTRESIEAFLSSHEARQLEEWQRGFIASQQELLRTRVDRGRVRDGHGDLRLEHVYLENDHAVTIIDCIEFNERFRIADVCCDLAFLTMDLAYHGRVDLAERLLAVYARESNDYELYRLINFYESYRAHVRAKVSLLLAADENVSPPAREAAYEQARRYFLLALAEEHKPIVTPAVVAIGGVIASGKSTLAGEIGARLGAPVIDSDRTRKFLAGVAADENLATTQFGGAYAPERTELVYSELLSRASAVLASGRSVVLDASFRQGGQRLAAQQLAERQGLPFYFIECQASRSQLERRLEQRNSRPGEVSDARGDLLDAFLSRWEAVEELPEGSHLVIDTGADLDETLHRLGELLPFWPTKPSIESTQKDIP